ncbi:MAG TPA: hypothetical protein VFP15_04070 [Gemmatimonadaceae bacterium]|nr:hypothetical protein [Gemmatimonadaceae bacterium]
MTSLRKESLIADLPPLRQAGDGRLAGEHAPRLERVGSRLPLDAFDDRSS